MRTPAAVQAAEGGPAVTIVVAPRERFSLTARSLESLYENTDTPFRLVYVDGGSPLEVARYLEREAARRGFELIRSERYLAPNEARNRGWLRADTRYVVFVDNDLVVTRGWLATLLRCAEETGADLVGPLYGIGEPEKGAIHMAGGLARIVETGGRRRLSESHRFAGRRVDEVEAQLAREPVELVEFHCMLARRETLLAHGPLDEELLSAAEHLDLCLFVTERGGTIYLEPSARVSYVPPPPLDPMDRRYFRLRWSEAWTARSMARMREKWRLDPEDPYFAEQVRWLRSHRRLRMRPLQKAFARLLGARLARYPNGALALAEIGWNRLRVRGAIHGRGPGQDAV
jgi:GT2 family glycosyltransferase